MKTIVGILSVVLSFQALSDEASLRYKCNAGFKSYALSDRARIDTCPEGKDTLRIDVTSVGGNYHTCWWPAKAKRSGDTYSTKSNDCELSFVITGKELRAEFEGSCRYYCGVRARFDSGLYVEESPNN